jgi:hypothetical protein
MVTGEQGGAAGVGVGRELRHHLAHAVVAGAEARPDRRMHVAGALARHAVPGEQQRRQQRRVEALHGVLRERLREVHRQQAVVRLHQAVERPGADAEHFVLGAPGELGQPRRRQRQPEPTPPRPQRGDQQGTRPRQPRLERDVGREGQRERARRRIEAMRDQLRLQQLPPGVQQVVG